MTAPCIPRQRKRTSKVKTGCGQCKRRRIKCGEQRPACERCAKAGLICSYDDGAPYSDLRVLRTAATALLLQAWGGTAAGLRSSLPVNMIVPRLARSLDADKIMYIERYGLSVAPVLSRIGSADFWFRTILREIPNDDCILHCVVAIGALEYAFETKTHGGSSDGTDKMGMVIHRTRTNLHYVRALKNMNLAISMMKVQMQRRNEEPPRRAILIVSILLTVFELMHGEPESADGMVTTAMAALHEVLPLFRPDRSISEKIGRDVDDDGIEEAEWLLPRLASMRGGISGLPVDLRPRRSAWESDACLKGLAETIKCPGQDVPHEIFMRTWDRYLTVQMFWTTRIDVDSITETERPVLHRQHIMIMGMATVWWHNIRQRIETETDTTRRLLLQVTYFFSSVSRLYLTKALLPIETTLEDKVEECMYAINIAEQFLDESEHESSLLLFNDKILPSIPALLIRCPVPEVRSKGLRLIARTIAMMEGEQKRSRTPPRNLWLQWWWTYIQLEGTGQQSIVARPIFNKEYDSPRSDGDDGDDFHSYCAIANEICMKNMPRPPPGQGGAKPTDPDFVDDAKRYENFVLCAIATCTI